MSAIIHSFNGTYIEHVDTYIHNQNNPSEERVKEHNTTCEAQAEDIQPVDTSFFCDKRFAPDIIEKNIREAIESASSKADACRRIMALETQGYILLSNVKDEQKAKLINPYAAPRFTLTGEDFRKARNS